MIYPIGIQNFESLRKDGYVYVDKTMHIHRLATTGRYYFLSRPRRFGKSLLLSTMKAYFLGQKDLFEGLALERLEEKWTKHPVLYLDLNTGKYDCEEELSDVLKRHILEWEAEYGANPEETTYHGRFLGVIRRAYEKTGERVVILVDEYDRPMQRSTNKTELHPIFHKSLKAIFSVLNTQREYIEFAFICGVSRLGMKEIFGDIDNLKDISMDREYHDMCGITENEIHTYFEELVSQLTNKRVKTSVEVYKELKESYGGFCFSPYLEAVYNPCSLMRNFSEERYCYYWYETGTPTFLINLLKQASFDLTKIQSPDIECGELYNGDITEDPTPFVYQSGFLTIKGYDEARGLYCLGFPNKEVERGFHSLLKYHF